MREIAITGAGLVLPNCDSRAEFWRQIRDGDCQISLCADPAAPAQRIPMGRIHDFEARRYLDEVPERFYNRFGRAQLLYLSSVFLACKDAGIVRTKLTSDRVGLFNGTSRDHLDV